MLVREYVRESVIECNRVNEIVKGKGDRTVFREQDILLLLIDSPGNGIAN